MTGWQDLVLAAGSISFALALIPTIRSTSKPAITTSITTAFWLLAFAFVDQSLSLWFGCVCTIITAIMWIVLAVQAWNANRLAKSNEVVYTHLHTPE
jgi:hypothetical protein